MSVATPTVLPRPPLFPTLMPRAHQPYPTPLTVPGRPMGRLILRRDFVQEMDDLSEEEAELEDNTLEVKNRGYGFLVPIGKVLTQHEEKNDADEGSEVDESARSSHPESPTDDGEGDGDGEDGGMDLDAEIEDMDDDLANTTAETEDLDDVDDIDASVLDE
ncbi:hypothetical protein EDB92DRAFT_2110146 [Lactarius akahatsu]|uniref:Uncharacterized protein n=1 Tax=Lactarius akahatsu TaxID=416441 RepID=A0AAD4QHT8_9AGAM|nr:hypothetical protein EDB92DRAFT_2110146 [Lactarius akahatsu]